MPDSIRIGIIGGTGLGDALRAEMDDPDMDTVEVATPFGPPSEPLTVGRYRNVPMALLSRHGPGHLINPAKVPYRANIFALKSLGCTHVIASGATGSLREHIAPGDVVVCDQLIDKTDGRCRTFYESAAVHVEFAEPFCPVLRRWLLGAGRTLEDVRVHEHGTYICMEGPSFSTMAEAHMHRAWGADLVGMTALPEARLAREAELAYCLVALPTDYDCWRPHDTSAGSAALLQEIMGNLHHAATASIALIKSALNDITPLMTEPSPAHDSLSLAIWSDRSRIDPAEVKRLSVLWGRHFD